MLLCRVDCWTEKHEEDDEPRGAVVIAEDIDRAEELSKAIYAQQGFTKFSGEVVADGFSGPRRVLGHTGQGPFSWHP